MLPTNTAKRRQGYRRLDGEEEEENWINLTIKAGGTIVLLSLIITLAFLRANRNGAFSTVGSKSSDAATTSSVSKSDNELLHEWNHQDEGEWSTAETTTSTTPERNAGLYAIATNEYSYLNQKMFAYPFLEDGILVEPYKPTKITIDGFSDGAGNNFYWSIVNVKDESIAFHGEAIECLDFTVTLTEVGEYRFIVEEQIDGFRDETRFRTLKQPLWVKYVRREISTLTDTDREDFLDAFKLLWDMQTKKGKDKYGDKYKSLNYLAMIHNDGGGNWVCDEFHSGTAFLNNHLYLRMYLEQSLRLINPSVSLHYMDYTKYFDSPAFTSSHRNNVMDGGTWSEILSDKWFGSNDPLTGSILDSRWKDTPIPVMGSKLISEESIPLMAYLFTYDDFKKSDQHVSNPYGLLRTPWNYNPSPYLTRYNNLNRLSTSNLDMENKFPAFMGSTCTTLKSFFSVAAAGKTLSNFLEFVEENVHANVRSTFGGAGGDRAAAVDELLRSQYALTDEHLFYVAEASHKFGEAYLSGRKLGFSENPLNCTTTPTIVRETGYLTTTISPGDVGGPQCNCNSYYYTSESTIDELINLYFIQFKFVTPLPYLSLLDKDFETKKSMMSLICSRLSFDGDMVGSGATMDPLFWVTHGAVERLYQRVMFEGVLTSDEFVNSKRGAPCPMHEENAVKTWLSGFYFTDTSIDASLLTNVELAEILDPRGDKYRDLIPTVYDNSEYAWCGESTEEFDSWLQPPMVVDDEQKELLHYTTN